MQYLKSTGDYTILESNIIYTYDADSDFEIVISPNQDFSFRVILKFVEDGDKKQELKREVNDTTIIFSCINFNDAGTGTINPLELATAEGKKIYMHFWAFKPVKTVRKIEYTVMIER